MKHVRTKTNMMINVEYCYTRYLMNRCLKQIKEKNYMLTPPSYNIHYSYENPKKSTLRAVVGRLGYKMNIFKCV